MQNDDATTIVDATTADLRALLGDVCDRWRFTLDSLDAPLAAVDPAELPDVLEARAEIQRLVRGLNKMPDAIRGAIRGAIDESLRGRLTATQSFTASVNDV